jgi:hypothetical protein
MLLQKAQHVRLSYSTDETYSLKGNSWSDFWNSAKCCKDAKNPLEKEI